MVLCHVIPPLCHIKHDVVGEKVSRGVFGNPTTVLIHSQPNTYVW